VANSVKIVRYNLLPCAVPEWKAVGVESSPDAERLEEWQCPIPGLEIVVKAEVNGARRILLAECKPINKFVLSFPEERYSVFECWPVGFF
jgi:hypothetical protein